MQDIRLPAFAALLAIAITATMDYTGYAQFSALPLFPLIILFWILARPTMAEWGLAKGTLQGYALAVLYPLAVMGPLALIAYFAGDFSTEDTNWADVGEEMALGIVATFIGAIITEEGFFRGTLWAGFKKAGLSVTKVLLLTSLVFSAWHISWAVLPGEGQLPWGQVPVYLLNAGLLGVAWGLLRVLSGSVLVASLSHGVWNGLAYSLFGIGANTGALGITNEILFDTEVGVIATTLNVLFISLLWMKMKKAGKI